jgi:alpha-glucosidase
MLTLKGTPFLYNGEEIGMSDLMLPAIEQFRDNLGLWVYRELTENFGTPAEMVFKVVQAITRDKCRTPMQWSNAPNAGFSPANVQTWLPVNRNYAEGINVSQQRDEPNSILNFYRRMLAVRKSNPALIQGDYRDVSDDSDKIFAFLRSSSTQRCLVALSYSDQLEEIRFDLASKAGNLIYSSADRAGSVDLTTLELAPFEILIVGLTE